VAANCQELEIVEHTACIVAVHPHDLNEVVYLSEEIALIATWLQSVFVRSGS
jgi:hypothetical protein